ncbi:hypothetical protein VN97_g11449, partial [Penicillium thymicola]
GVVTSNGYRNETEAGVRADDQHEH